jgi:hypothetical protein
MVINMERDMKMMLRKGIYGFLGIILTISIVLTGCAGTDLTAEEILSNTVTAMGKIETYQVAYDMVLDMEIVGGDEAMKMSMDGTGTGAMDIPKEKMQMNMDINAEIPGSGTSQMSMKMAMGMYMVDGWLYTQMNIPMAEEQWNKTKVEGNEVSQNQLAQLVQMLKTTTQTTLTGTEKVSGTDCYVLKITPNLEDLFNWLMSQSGALNEGFDFSQFDISKLIKNFELKYWIAKSNFNIAKASADMSMDVTPDTVGASSEDFERMTMVVSMSMTFSQYNQPVDIQLPAEAANAVEVSQ